MALRQLVACALGSCRPPASRELGSTRHVLKLRLQLTCQPQSMLVYPIDHV